MRSLICAVALFAIFGSGQTWEGYKCSTGQYGAAMGTPVQLPTVELPPGNAVTKILVPLPCPIPNGALAIACEEEIAPNVVFADIRTIFVTRFSSLTSVATVSITVYCPTMYKVQTVPVKPTAEPWRG